VIHKELNAGSEQRSKQFNSTLRPQVEELGSENDFMDDSINQTLVDGFEGLFQTELLALLAGYIVEDNVG
jgi:hypothetical protein